MTEATESADDTLNIFISVTWIGSDERQQSITAPLKDVDVTVNDGVHKFHCFFHGMPEEVKNAFRVLLEDLGNNPEQQAQVILAIGAKFWLKRFEGKSRLIVHQTNVGVIEIVDIQGNFELTESYATHNDKRMLVFDDYAIDGSRL